MKEKLLEFLKSQKVVIIASNDEDLWISNVYYCVDDSLNLYFVSNPERKHSKQIINNSKVAFSVVWFNEKNLEDRKAVQGQGVCRMLESDEEIKNAVDLYNKTYPGSSDTITFDWIKNNSGIWIIEPSFIKHWDDELYGQEGTGEFKFF